MNLVALLARAVRPEKSEDLTSVDLKLDAFDGFQGAVRFVQNTDDHREFGRDDGAENGLRDDFARQKSAGKSRFDPLGLPG
jgi:hypothetical protein